MQSSAAVAGRALIMLACVVGIPALALSGSSWSEMVKKLQDFRWPAILDLASASSSPSLDKAPRFTASNSTATPTSGSDPAKLGQVGLASPLRPMAARSDVVPAGYQAPAESAAVAVPAVEFPAENSRSTDSTAADPFRSIQDRLRQLGATYYLLESWGSHQQLYRFYCKMAVGGNADYTRHFEATNSDPLHAMTQVLRQVVRWRDGGANSDR